MSISKKLIRSSSTLVLIRIIHRFLGIISLLILARLLTPDDFAIIALTTIIVHFIDMLSNLGSEHYIIQKKNVLDVDIDTSWTLDILSKVGIWIFLFFLSPHLASFFEQPLLQDALIISSLIIIINAIKNPGILLLKKNLDYQKIFKLSIIQKVSSSIVVIILALYLQSYWALIIGDIVASIIFTIGSYLIHYYRPNLSIQKTLLQWQFSKWLLFKGIVGYTRSQIDTIIVSKFFTSAHLGQYYMARDIAMLPNQVLLAPAIEPLLAAFTQFRGDIISFGKNVNFCIFIVGIVSIPISFYIWYFPLPLIGTLLGEQWVSSSNILKSMAFLFLYFNFVLVVEQALIALKRIRLLFFFDLFSLLAVTTVLIISVSSDMPIEEIALVRGLTGVITTCIIFIIMSNLINLNKMRLVCFFVVITLLSAVSVEIVQLFKLTSFNVHLYNLVASGTVFVLCYSSSLLIIFYIFSDLDEIQKLLKLSGKSSCSN